MEFVARNKMIVADVQDGKSYGQVAKSHNISRERVRQICARHGVLSQHAVPLPTSEEEVVEIVSQFYRGRPIAHIDTRRSLYTTRKILVRTGVLQPAPQAPRWDIQRDRMLRELWGSQSCTQIATQLGTTKSAVIGRAHRLGLQRLKKGLPNAS
jgi:hypothetical protein